MSEKKKLKESRAHKEAREDGKEYVRGYDVKGYHVTSHTRKAKKKKK